MFNVDILSNVLFFILFFILDIDIFIEVDYSNLYNVDRCPGIQVCRPESSVDQVSRVQRASCVLYVCMCDVGTFLISESTVWRTSGLR